MNPELVRIDAESRLATETPSETPSVVKLVDAESLVLFVYAEAEADFNVIFYSCNF